MTVSVLFSTVSFNYSVARLVGKRMIKKIKKDLVVVFGCGQSYFGTLQQRSIGR